MDPIKIGMVGCGWYGNVHLDTLLQTPGVEVAALATANAARLAETGKKAPSARLYQTAEQMLSCEKLDAAVVCVTPERHGKIEREAAKRGVHLYVEKPVGLSLPEARETARVIRESGVLAAAGYQQRYSPMLEEIRAMLPQKKVGLVSGRWIGWPAPALWWRNKEQSGGQLVEQATHIVDALRYLFGEVESVYSVGRKGLSPLPGSTVEDCSFSVLRFGSGVLASLQAGCYLDREAADGAVGFEIYCDDLRIEYRWSGSARFITKDEDRTVQFGASHQQRALQTFIEAVRRKDGALLRSTYEDAVETLAVTLAANRSMETGLPVSPRTLLPLT